MPRLTITPLRALRDNYVYLLLDHEQNEAAVVDPSEAAPVLAALAERPGMRLRQIWCTHHHWDHVGGNAELVEKLGAIEVFGSVHDGEKQRIPAQTQRLADGDRFTFAGAAVEAMLIPGHTLGHVAYRVLDNVFPGDTLFGCGCGRLFEGTPAQMVASLGRLRALPEETRVWCGHEYTLHNVKFNADLAIDDSWRERMVPAGQWTVPLTIGGEKKSNLFLRWDDPLVAAWAGVSDPVEVFAAVRRAKDTWKET
jgi:hydroxyacylglutathione hydrolase